MERDYVVELNDQSSKDEDRSCDGVKYRAHTESVGAQSVAPVAAPEA